MFWCLKMKYLTKKKFFPGKGFSTNYLIRKLFALIIKYNAEIIEKFWEIIIVYCTVRLRNSTFADESLTEQYSSRHETWHFPLLFSHANIRG